MASLAFAGCAEEDDDSATTPDGGGTALLDAGRPDGALGDATIATEAGATACGTLTYANFGKSFLETNCLSCHSAMPVGNTNSFHTVELVRQRRLDMIAHAVEPRQMPTMPPGRALPPADQAKLKEWLTCGAP